MFACYASTIPTEKPPLPRRHTKSQSRSQSRCQTRIRSRPVVIHRFEIDLALAQAYASNPDTFKEEEYEFHRAYNEWTKRLASAYKRLPLQKRGHLRVRYVRLDVDDDSVSVARSDDSDSDSDTDDTNDSDSEIAPSSGHIPTWDRRIVLLFTSNTLTSEFMKLCDEFNDYIYNTFDSLFDISQFNMCMPVPYISREDLDSIDPKK